MIGLSDKSWIIEMIHGSGVSAPKSFASNAAEQSVYDTYFGLGHTIQLIDRPGVFKVSLAGVVLGAHLVSQVMENQEISGKFLDLGTGSGVQALLLRSLGATDIVATDICAESIELAAENELLNFDDNRIELRVGDLFDALKPANGKFDTIVFNPPGWRTPSAQFLDKLRRINGDADMALSSMFYGDSTLTRFLTELPDHLHPRGRAIVGMNSLVGIQDVLSKYRDAHSGRSPLSFRLIERHTLPLLFYSEHWKRAESLLRSEFQSWQDAGAAAYTVDSQNQLYWSYELVECRLNQRDHRRQ